MRRLTSSIVVLGLAAGGVVAASTPGQAAKKPGTAYDFDGDGHRDLVAGLPQATVRGKRGAGLIAVVYGSRSGLNPKHRQVITRDTAGVPGVVTANDDFGAVTASGDFDGDGYADLAIGGGASPAARGRVTIMFGGRSGLGRPVTFQQPAGTGTDPAAFGEHLSAGDIGRGGRADLLIESGVWNPLMVVYGAASVRTKAVPVAVPQWTRDTEPGPADLSASVADVTGDGYGDAVFAYHQSTGGADVRLHVTFIPGGAGGLGTPVTRVFGSPGRMEGASLALGDVNGDGRADAVIGEDDLHPKGVALGGQVTVLYGGKGGLTGRPQVIDQNTAGVPDSAERGDRFGQKVSVGDVNGDRRADVAVASPGERTKTGGRAVTGQLTVLYGGARGLLAGAKAQAFTMRTKGMPKVSTSGGAFSDFVLRDFNADKRAEIALDANEGTTFVLAGTKAGLTTKGAKAIRPGQLGLRLKDVIVPIGYPA